tara:strand:- start:87438 stop:88970 length:1533 start_codon:yes stop_codon:yes gene_type:complete
MKSVLITSWLILQVTISCYAQTNPNFTNAFIQTYLPSIEITMNDSTYQWMVNPNNIYSSNYQYCTASYKGPNGVVINYDTLGIRLRGNTSRAKYKKSFKFHFDKFTANQNFYGLKKVNLKAETNDPSLIREHLVMNMYREMDVPVARVNHTKLYINSTFMGVYSNIEQIDSRFLKSRFNNKNGNLYKCSWGADLAHLSEVYNDGIYELKTNEIINDRSHLSAFITFLTTSTDTEFENKIENYLNVSSYINQLVIEVLTGHWDSYAYNKNNYYLYYNTAKNWFEYIPYDTDNTLGIDWVGKNWSNRNIYSWTPQSGANRPLTNRLLSIHKYAKQYSLAMRLAITTFYNSATQVPKANSLKSLIDSAIFLDTYCPLDFGFTYSNFQNSITQNIPNTHVDFGIEPFINARNSSANQQLKPIYLSVADVTFDDVVKIYPNPISRNGILNIEISNQSISINTLTISNMLGQTVYQSTLSNNKARIALENFVSGVYIIQFNDPNGVKQQTKRILIY